MSSAERALRVGNRACDPLAAAANVARSTGYALEGGIGHGTGLDDHDPPRLTADDRTMLSPGMVLAMHPKLIDLQKGRSATLGDTYVLEGGEPQKLSKITRDVHWVD